MIDVDGRVDLDRDMPDLSYFAATAPSDKYQDPTALGGPLFQVTRHLLRGTIVNRTYGVHKNIFNLFYEQYLVLLTMVPRDR